MRIGIDFDNTLVCYDELFWTLAWDCGLIDESVPRRKDAVRDDLRRRGLEPLWTQLQGQAYGPRILEATPFSEVLAAVTEFRQRGWDVFVVSHKTRVPISGEQYDLHAAALGWLRTNGLIGEVAAPISGDRVFFELTKREKLRRISEIDCDWFIDDLPELLTDTEFPSHVGRILFDPHHQVESLPDEIRRLSDWRRAAGLLAKESIP